jgi:hemoglobin
MSPVLPQSRPAAHREPAHARAAKRAEAIQLGIDEDFIDAMVERFYGSVRADALLGPIFDARIADWPHHLARMKQF